MRRNSKALSPVVASIILIAVTVAVSVVAAGWLGGTTIGLIRDAEQVSVVNVGFPNASTIQVWVRNAAGSDSSIAYAYINNVAALVSSPIAVYRSSSQIITFVAGENATFTLSSGTSYTIKLITSKGTSVVSAPTMYGT